MDTLEKKIADSINEKMNDGSIEKLISEQLEKGIKTALESTLGWRGDSQKLLSEKFDSVMVSAIETHDFNKYLIKLDTVLTELINNTSIKDNETILMNFKKIMKKPVDDFNNVPISKIYEEYQKYVSENIDTSNLEVNTDETPSYYDATTSMEVEELESRGWFSRDRKEYVVRFTCEEDENMNCEFKLEKLDSKEDLRIDASTIPIDIHSLNSMSEFEIFIQQLLRAWSKIELDITESYEDDVEIKAEPEASFY